MKKILPVTWVVLILSALFSSCQKQDQKISLVMSELNPEESVSGRMSTVFKQKVEELSEGKIEIRLFFSGILGDQKQVMEILKTPGGTIQLASGPGNFSTYLEGGAEKSSLLSIPYTFKNDEHFWAFANSPLAEQILNEPYEMGLGVKGLYYAHEGFRHFFSNQKIDRLEDLSGKKMRVPGKVFRKLASAFNSVPVEVSYTNLYASFQTGLVDVAEQPISNYLSNSFNQVAPYLILDSHIIGSISVLINSECWDSLSQNQKNVLILAGKYAADYCHQIVDDANDLAMVILKSEGVTITPVEDIKPWQNACIEMRNEAAAVDPELYQQILDLAK